MPDFVNRNIVRLNGLFCRIRYGGRGDEFIFSQLDLLFLPVHLYFSVLSPVLLFPLLNFIVKLFYFSFSVAVLAVSAFLPLSCAPVLPAGGGVLLRQDVPVLRGQALPDVHVLSRHGTS